MVLFQELGNQKPTGTRGCENSLRVRNLAELGNFYMCTISSPHHHNDDLIALPSEFARVLHREGISAIRARTSPMIILLHSSCKTSLS
jgi:hypothetical protein